MEFFYFEKVANVCSNSSSKAVFGDFIPCQNNSISAYDKIFTEMVNIVKVNLINNL
jgi:mevalonate pyrophosphate decarboxylase